jgi:hypothetical protein
MRAGALRKSSPKAAHSSGQQRLDTAPGIGIACSAGILRWDRRFGCAVACPGRGTKNKGETRKVSPFSFTAPERRLEV